jgi:hypothetical protein
MTIRIPLKGLFEAAAPLSAPIAASSVPDDDRGSEFTDPGVSFAIGDDDR